MSYTELVGAGIAMAIVLDLVVLRTRLLCRRSFWTAYAIMCFFQLIVNGVLTGLPVVRYNPSTILGPRLVHAPIEDVGFGFALILATLSSWVALLRARNRRASGGVG